LRRFLIKALFNAAIVVPLLMWFTEATFWGALLTALAISVVAWYFGDLFVLKASNNTVATLADAGLALVMLWVIADFAEWGLNMAELVITAGLLAVGEAIFHRWLAKQDGTTAKA
jgi:hypothetical protein